MLGFTRHELSNRSYKPVILLSVIILFTTATLWAMIDSFILHRLSEIMSPHQRREKQGCAMSYSRPTYTRIQTNSLWNKKYVLYLFREDYIDTPKLSGIPALFIPGQSGSHKQIRSLAAETAKYYQKHSTGQHTGIDFFTVDLNEELSALNGQTLRDQAYYMNDAIKDILSLYSSTPINPDSVLIIGHSMGGLIARTLFMLPNYQVNSVNTIITIATPHLQAPMLLDSNVYKIYNDITNYWTPEQFKAAGPLNNVTAVSIAGGSLDGIIHSDGVNIATLVPESHGFTVFTTSIPNVWTGCDHMAILWCNQLLKVLAPCLLDLVDKEHPGHSLSVPERMDIFRQHLLKGKRVSVGAQDAIRTISELNVTHNEFYLSLDHITSPSIVLIDINQAVQIITNIPSTNDDRWRLVVCKKEADRLDFDGSVVPIVSFLPNPSTHNLIHQHPYRLSTPSNLEKYKDEDYTHIGLIDVGGNPLSEEMFMAVNTLSDPIVHPVQLWDLIPKTYDFNINSYRSIHEFPSIKNSLFAYDIRVIKMTPVQPLIFDPMIQQSVGNQEIKFHRHLEEGVSDRITFHQAADGLSLTFYLPPSNSDLQMTMSLSIDWYSTLGRFVLRYGSSIIPVVYSTCLIVVLSQIYSYLINGKREFIPFQMAYVQCLFGPFTYMAIMLVVISILQIYCSQVSWLDNYPVIQNIIIKNMLLGSPDYAVMALCLFIWTLSLGLLAFVWMLINMTITILSIPIGWIYQITPRLSMQGEKLFVVTLTITIGLLSVVPPSVIIVFFSIIWLWMTCSARFLAQSVNHPE
ncbi:PGAP1-like protein-domain-containing protein [Pilobolus umbonatus]|nr:PGAP1-like protein-domain-containing protein [Pilobolus umbonatus]